MNAIIAFGTGRGTTGRIAEQIADGMAAAGVRATAVGVQWLAPTRVGQADILGVGTPVHFYREARYLTSFLATLPRLEGRRAFLFCTCGMDRPGETLRRLYTLLTERGASVVGAEAFRSAMSYYLLRARRLGNPDDLPGEGELEAARQYGVRMARAHELRPIDPPRVSLLTALKARLLANVRIRSLIFPGVRLNTALCTGYGSCLSRCLLNGLDRHDGDTLPYITDACVRCLECIAWCPRGAIEPDSRLKEWTATLSYRLGIH
jgi:NAD-dependent dihydropyrimidine dehydrogenase PreA subunit/flavodoxin